MRRRKYSDDFRGGYRHSYSREMSPLEQIARTALELHKLLGVDNLDLRNHFDRSNDVRSRVSDRRNDFSNHGDNNIDDDNNEDDNIREEDHVRYHSLCVSNISHRLCDSDIREEIYHHCKYCGDFNVKISSYNGERVAYINFRSSRQAAKANDCLKSFKLDSKIVRIEPVINNANGGRSPKNVRQRSPVYSYNYDSYPQNNRRCNDSYSPVRYNRHRSRSNSRLSNKLPGKSNHNVRDLNSIPTRTLFIGNLPFDITEKGLKDVFSKFGEVTDIDIKKPVTNRQASSYAFIKFENLDIANQVKNEMSGYTIGKCQIKIGFGKVNPTSCVWVGGLGPWILYDTFEKEMTRFGAVKQIEWPHNKSYAYVLYESVDVAITAVNKLRGTHFCDESKPIKVDFADISVMKPIQPKKEPENKNRDILKKSLKDSVPYVIKASPKSDGSSTADDLSIYSSKSIPQLITCLVDVWTGMIVLKNNNFGCRLFILKGEKSIINDFMFSKNINDESKSHVENLTITQRMKLDRQKLTEMSQRIDSAGENGFCLLLASSYIIDNKLAGDNLNQPQRPLKNLITYLRTKDSAGVIFLKSHNKSSATGVLHAFPPCDFSFNILLQKAPNLTKDYLKDDFLVVLLIRNSA